MHCVDLGESFPTSIYLQKSASIQPRTSPSKFGGKYSILFTGVLRGTAFRCQCSLLPSLPRTSARFPSAALRVLSRPYRGATSAWTFGGEGPSRLSGASSPNSGNRAGAPPVAGCSAATLVSAPSSPNSENSLRRSASKPKIFLTLIPTRLERKS